jgi:hypothetical protein
MKRLTSMMLASALLVLSLGESAATGAYEDVYFGYDDLNPVWDSNTSTWVWEKFTKIGKGGEFKKGYQITIMPGDHAFLGLENEARLGYTKEIWLKYDGYSGRPFDLRLRAGTKTTYSEFARVVESRMKDPKLIDAVTGMWEIRGEITPQPDWEILKFRNNTTKPIRFTIKEFDSKCKPSNIPAPAVTALVALGGVVALGRGRRRPTA